MQPEHYNHIAHSGPPGYWEDARGNLIPEANVKDIDKMRDDLVRRLFAKAASVNAALAEFKGHAMEEVAAFVSISGMQYGAKLGGEKGNTTLTTHDGRLKLHRAIQEKIAFDEALLAAKSLIDECINTWAKDSNDKIKALVGHAFQVDGQGQVSTTRVLGLRTLKIDDAKWQEAMKAIAESMKTVSTKAYLRFYERDDSTGEYKPLSLDASRV